MPAINILDESTINKIAAGEVVERPVNVVKELVENAIDAGAANISIEIKGGGIDYIRITDNGSGIECESIPTAFVRHATSKIRTIEDLMSISSLGFRGEALASIAAVSRVNLMTKTADSIVGYSYRIEGGREMSFDEAGVPDGTTVIVKDLFYNTPARRKFLKSANTEAGYITELVERLILSHPDISFKYVCNGMTKLSSAGLGDPAADVYSVFGRDAAAGMVPVDHENGACTVRGFVAKPENSRGNRNFEIFFVNGRYIKSRVLTSAVEEAYRSFLMQHRFPFVILFLDLPSETIDVNVHPSKTEIRFCEERSVYSCVYDAVTEGITRRELIPEFHEEVREEKPAVKPPAPLPHIPEPFETARIEKYRQEAIESKSEPAPVQETLFKEGFLSEEAKAGHRIIGQVFDTYWLIEYDKKLYIIDQHAAHEKILYERLLKQIRANSVISQNISPPYIVSLSQAEEDTVREHAAELEKTGFKIEHFGGREYAICSVPSELFGMVEQDYLLSMLDELSENRSLREPGRVMDRIATMACKAAVKGNMHLSFAEADALIGELLTLDNPYNCPHGRPTIISFSRSDLEKMFKRIV